MTPEKFNQAVEARVDGHTTLLFTGKTATDGIRVAMLEKRLESGGISKIVVAADTHPDSEALSEHIVGSVRTFRHIPGQRISSWVDGIPIENIEGFADSASKMEVLSRHAATLSSQEDRSADDLLIAGFAVDAVAVNIGGGAVMLDTGNDRFEVLPATPPQAAADQWKAPN